jgi:hypothetical protein
MFLINELSPEQSVNVHEQPALCLYEKMEGTAGGIGGKAVVRFEG